MKEIILFVSILGTIQFSFAQTGSPPALATNPTTTQVASNFSWYRGGNNPTGPVGVNNIFSTRWTSDIWIMTNSTNIARFTHNQSLAVPWGAITPPRGGGDGLSI